MQGTTEFHHQIADPLLPQADPVLHNATTLDAGMRISTSGSVNDRKPRSCNNRLRTGKG